MEKENEVFLLTQEEAEALVKKGYNEALMWAVEAIKRFPEHSPEEIIKTVHSVMSSEINSIEGNPIFVGNIQNPDLKDFSFRILNGDTVQYVSEEPELVEEEKSIYDMMLEKYEASAKTTEEQDELEPSPVLSATVEYGSEPESIFDQLAKSSGLFSSAHNDEAAVEEETVEIEDNIQHQTETVEVSDETTSDYVSLEQEYINAAVEDSNEKNELETVEETVIAEVSEDIEEPEIYDVDGETSIFDQLATQTGLIIGQPESETKEEPAEAENKTVEETVIAEASEDIEEPEETVIAEVSEDIEEPEIYDVDGETSIFDQLATQTGLIIEQPESENAEEPAETENEPVEEPEETILAEVSEEDYYDSKFEGAGGDLIAYAEEEAITPEEKSEISQTINNDNPEVNLEEDATENISNNNVIKNVNINRYVYESIENDGEPVSEEYENGITIDKPYTAEESGGIINNTLLVQEFDAEKKLVSKDVGGETEMTLINKEYEPGEEYTIITETVIKKDEEENPETAKEFGGDVNIKIGGGYEAPEEEQSEIIPAPEVKIEVAEKVTDGKSKKKRKLFGKDEEEQEYETEIFIPSVEIDEAELAAQASSEGLSREGRNIGMAGLGSSGIEIADEVYDGDKAPVVEDSSTYLGGITEVEEEPEAEEASEDETPQMVNPNINARQLIKDVKIIDSL